MLSLELFINADFYASHPLLDSVFKSNKDVFSKFNTVFFLSLSHKTTDLNESLKLFDIDLVKKEVIFLCRDKSWCSLMGILSLSSILKQKLQLFYPDFGPKSYRTLWNNLILPRHSYVNSNAFVSDKGLFRLLYCKFYCVDAMENFSANHSVLPISKLKQNLNLLKHSLLLVRMIGKKSKSQLGVFNLQG